MDMLAKMVERGLGAVEVRADVHERYNEDVAREHENMVWTHPGMTTYYRNSRGRITINSPYRNVDFFEMTKQVNLDEYVTEPQRQRELVAD
jgi:4-hydroxyacetophenone monooxygenase